MHTYNIIKVYNFDEINLFFFPRYLLIGIILNSISGVKTRQKKVKNKIFLEMIQVVIITILYFEMGDGIESRASCF